MPVVLPIIELFLRIIEEVMPLLVGALQWFADNVIPGVKTVLEGFVTVISDIADAFKTVVTWVEKTLEKIGLFNNTKMQDKTATVTTVHKTVNETTKGGGGRSFDAPTTTSAYKTMPDTDIFNFTRVGAAAEGIDSVSEAGRYLVGERGPEEVYLPQGAAVKPNSALGGTTIVINNPKFFNENDMRKFGNGLYQRWQLAGVGDGR